MIIKISIREVIADPDSKYPAEKEIYEQTTTGDAETVKDIIAVANGLEKEKKVCTTN